MNRIRYLIPNGLTALNLVSGATAIIFMFENQLQKPYIPVFLICLAALFDVLDGLTAKLLKATSEFGKQLDSLSDLISFGLAPAYMMYRLMAISFTDQSVSATFQLESTSIGDSFFLYSALTIVVFAALRLARFNITTTQGSDFVGLPVPASALVIVALWVEFHMTESNAVKGIILNPYVLLGVIILLSFLMISNISMLSLKFNGVNLKDNIWRYLLLAGSLLIIIVFGANALLFIMIYYLLLSFLRNIIR